MGAHLTGRDNGDAGMLQVRTGEPVADQAGTFFVGLESKCRLGAPNRDRPTRTWAQASKSSHRLLSPTNRANPSALRTVALVRSKSGHVRNSDVAAGFRVVEAATDTAPALRNPG